MSAHPRNSCCLSCKMFYRCCCHNFTACDSCRHSLMYGKMWKRQPQLATGSRWFKHYQNITFCRVLQFHHLVLRGNKELLAKGLGGGLGAVASSHQRARASSLKERCHCCFITARMVEHMTYITHAHVKSLISAQVTGYIYIYVQCVNGWALPCILLWTLGSNTKISSDVKWLQDVYI